MGAPVDASVAGATQTQEKNTQTASVENEGIDELSGDDWYTERSQYRKNILTVWEAFESGEDVVSLSQPAPEPEVQLKNISNAYLLSVYLGLTEVRSIAYLQKLQKELQGGRVILDKSDYLATYLAICRCAEQSPQLVQEVLGLMEKMEILAPATEADAKYEDPTVYLQAALYLLDKDAPAEKKTSCARNMRKTTQVETLLERVVSVPEVQEEPKPKKTTKPEKVKKKK